MTQDRAAITAIGFALPELRVPAKAFADAWGASTARDVKQAAVPAFDEDEVTLAVDAAARALAAAGVDPVDVGMVIVATGGAAPVAGTVAEVTGVTHARALDVTGRQAAGVTALWTGADAVAASGRAALVVAADVPRAAPGDPAEHGQGAAAAAFVLAPGGGVRVDAAGAAAADLPGAPRLDRHGALRAPDVAVEDASLLPRALAGVAPDGGVDFLVQHPARARVTGADGKPVEPARATPTARPVVGDAGAAGALLDLAAALADATPGTRGLLAVTEGGRAVALRLTVDARPAGDGDVAAAAAAGREVTYLRALQERGAFRAGANIPEEPMGAYVSLPDFAASLPQRYRLEGARCLACGTLAFPPRATCGACGARDFEPVPLSGRGSVYAATRIGRGGAPSEFALEQAMTGAYDAAVVELEEGPRVAARLTGFQGGDVPVGASVRAVVRRLYEQQGVVRYGFKFRPA